MTFDARKLYVITPSDLHVKFRTNKRGREFFLACFLLMLNQDTLEAADKKALQTPN